MTLYEKKILRLATGFLHSLLEEIQRENGEIDDDLYELERHVLHVWGTLDNEIEVDGK